MFLKISSVNGDQLNTPNQTDMSNLRFGCYSPCFYGLSVCASALANISRPSRYYPARPGTYGMNICYGKHLAQKLNFLNNFVNKLEYSNNHFRTFCYFSFNTGERWRRYV